MEPVAHLSEVERARTARHIRIPDIGEVGQRRLAGARVAVLGAGGLGAPILQYLAAAGVGTLAVIDDDVVDVTNLQRQVIHSVAKVGTHKVESAAERMREVAPEVAVRPIAQRLTPENAADMLRGYDVVLDGTDNFPTRYLVADTCADAGIPLVWGSVLRFDAQVSVFWSNPPQPVPPTTLRDLFPHPPADGEVPSCAEAGVMGALCGVVGSMMALEAIKLIVGVGEVLLGRVAVVDALTMRVHDVPFGASSTPGQVEAGGGTPSRESAADPALPRTAVGASDLGHAPQASAPPSLSPTPPRAATAQEVRALPPGLLIDVREPEEFQVDAVAGAVNIPVGAIESAQRLGSQEVKDLLHSGGFSGRGEVVAYCAAGIRAKRAVRTIVDAGVSARFLPPEEVDLLRATGRSAAEPTS